MILAEEWEEEEWKADQNEGHILIKLNLKYEMIYSRKEKQKNKLDQSSDQFGYPREKFIKLNFDGEAR